MLKSMLGRLRTWDAEDAPPDESLLPVSFGQAPDGPGTFEQWLTSRVVAAMAGRPVRPTALDATEERMATGATFPADALTGVVHLWGAGVAGDKASRDAPPRGFRPSRDAQLAVYATRGAYSAALLEQAGVEVPPIFGDPLWFAARVSPFRAEAPSAEIGVVLPRGFHQLDSVQRAALKRVAAPAALSEAVLQLDFDVEPTEAALEALARRVGRCRRLLVAEPSQMILGEALGVPTALFARGGGGLSRPRVDDELLAIPSEARDLYTGFGAERLLICRQPFGEATRWESIIKSMDLLWEPTSFDPRPFFDAFPTDPVVDFDDEDWSLPEAVDPAGRAPAAPRPSALTVAARIAATIGRGSARDDAPPTTAPMSPDAAPAPEPSTDRREP